jgi:hypothetical protein
MNAMAQRAFRGEKKATLPIALRLPAVFTLM